MRYIKIFEDFEENIQFSQLIGEIINEIYISYSEDNIYFVTDNEVHNFYTQNDCCNTVWFNHLNGVDDVIHQIVRSVESKDWSEADDYEGKSGDVIEACMWTLNTNRGRLDIEVRNSHNGYYGGSVGHNIIKIEDFRKGDFKLVIDDF